MAGAPAGVCEERLKSVENTSARDDLSDFTIRQFTRPEYRLGALAFSPDGTKLFVTGWEQNKVEFFDAATGEFLDNFVVTSPSDPGFLSFAHYILFAPPTGE